MHQKGRFFASETLNYAFFSQKTGCFCTEMIHSVFGCTLLGAWIRTWRQAHPIVRACSSLSRRKR